MSHEEIIGLLLAISFFLAFWGAEKLARKNPDSWAAGILPPPDLPLGGPPKIAPASEEKVDKIVSWSSSSPAYRLLVMAAARALRDLDGQALTVEDFRAQLLEDGVRLGAGTMLSRAMADVPGVVGLGVNGYFLPVEEGEVPPKGGVTVGDRPRPTVTSVDQGRDMGAFETKVRVIENEAGLRAEAKHIAGLVRACLIADNIPDPAVFLERVGRFAERVAHPLRLVTVKKASSWENAGDGDPRGDIMAALDHPSQHGLPEMHIVSRGQAENLARVESYLRGQRAPRVTVHRAGGKVVELVRAEADERTPCAPEGFTAEAVPERGQTCFTCTKAFIDGAGEDPDIPEEERPLYEIDPDRWHHARCVPGWHPETEVCDLCRGEQLAPPEATTGPEIIGGAIYRLPSRSGGIGTVVQIYPGAGRDAHGRLYCCSTDPNRHRVYHDEEALLMLLDEKPTESRAMWAWWDRLLRGEVPLAPTTSNDRNPAPKETP